MDRAVFAAVVLASLGAQRVRLRVAPLKTHSETGNCGPTRPAQAERLPHALPSIASSSNAAEPGGPLLLLCSRLLSNPSDKC
jgi:hypothetical protein